jgi:hypothetical protein
MTPAIGLLLFVSIGLPVGYSWRLLRLDEATRAACLAIVAEASFIVALVFVVGRWDIAGYYTRFILATIFLIALAIAWRRHAARPWREPGARPLWRSHFATLASASLLGVVVIVAVVGLLPQSGASNLALPLQGGHFMVGQGGANRLLNHHAPHPAQRHAVDITAIGAGGFRATGLLPADLQRYAIHGASVVSPCAGTVVAARDGLADLVPPNADADNPAGNHVVIGCEGFEVKIAHLQRGSLAVAAGDTVGLCDAIGRVGNSGHSTEPHLHLHAVDPKTGEGVPVTFDSRTPVRNKLFRNATCPSA